ncbi:MAG: tripartite tricarboxylate transporter TctB family protein [Betaproteobacteria bacterium]
MVDRLRAIAPYVVVLAIATWLFDVALHFRFSPRAGSLGPGLWPRAILALTIIVCVMRIGYGLFARRAAIESGTGDLLHDVAAGIPQAAGPAAPPAPRYPLLLLVGIALTIAYVALLGTLGFALATFAYMAAMMAIGRYRRRGVIVVVALLGSLVLMFIFMKIVYLSLPIGVAPFDTVSLTLMKLMGIR